MVTFTVKEDKCNRCGFCMAECPASIISQPSSAALPEVPARRSSGCINCGHCVAVCPFGAISLDFMKPEDCSASGRKLLVSADQLEYFLKSRRSIRSYKSKPVPREMLAKLIDIARYAPSGHNSQPVQWTVVEDARQVKKLSGMVIDRVRTLVKESPVPTGMEYLIIGYEQGKDLIFRGAPHVIVAHAPKGVMGMESSHIASAYLELAAYAQGLGACWAGFFMGAAANSPGIIEALGLPEGNRCYGAMMVGYPAHDFKRIPLKKEPSITWI